MKHSVWGTLPNDSWRRPERGAVTVPCPTKEQKAAEDAQVRLLEAALASAGSAHQASQIATY